MSLPAISDSNVLHPDFAANALARYHEGLAQLVRWYAGDPMTLDERAAAMRASFTRRRLMNEAGLQLDESPAS